MEKNKVTTYLLYALGEIFLVVIGIMIAVSLNNWNANIIAKKNALDLAERLLIESNTNIESIEQAKQRMLNISKADLGILEMIGDDYKSKELEKLDSLMSISLGAPKLSLQVGVLNQSISSIDLNNFINAEAKNTLNSIPSMYNQIKNSEESLGLFLNDHLIPEISGEYSIRNMDVKSTPGMAQVGLSQLSGSDGRLILTSRPYENALDNKFYVQKNLIDRYDDLQLKFEKLSQNVSEAITQLRD